MKLITIKEAAEMLSISAPRLYQLARAGVLPGGVQVRLGRQLRFDADALREWVRSGGQALRGGWRRLPPTSRGEVAK